MTVTSPNVRRRNWGKNCVAHMLHDYFRKEFSHEMVQMPSIFVHCICLK